MATSCRRVLRRYARHAGLSVVNGMAQVLCVVCHWLVSLMHRLPACRVTRSIAFAALIVAARTGVWALGVNRRAFIAEVVEAVEAEMLQRFRAAQAEYRLRCLRAERREWLSQHAQDWSSRP